MTTIAFLGLGVMGDPMAGHLAAAGHDVIVYNRTISKAEKWAERHKGKVAASPEEAVLGAEFVCCCVGRDEDVRSVTVGKGGAFYAMAQNAVFVDHTKTSASLARDLYRSALEQHFHYLDAPVSGGQAGAEKGQLTIMSGGDQTAFDRVQSILNAYGRKVSYIGEAGSGQLAKMVNQICIAGIIQGLSEGLSFAAKAGLDIENVIAAVSEGAAQSWQMNNRWQSMAEGRFDFGFAIDWMRKDLGYCLDEADRNGASLPVTALVDQFYKELQQKGDGRLDTSSLIKRLQSA